MSSERPARLTDQHVKDRTPKPLSDDREPWERQRGESQKAFAAFAIYRDMGTQRSQRKVAQQLGKSNDLIGYWSKVWSWVERAELWDQKLDRKKRQAQLDAIEEMKERHIKTAMVMQGKGLKRLEKLQEKTIETDLDPANARLYILEGARLERISRGEPEQIIEDRKKVDPNEIAAISQLVCDPGFLGAIQQAAAGPKGEGGFSSASGPVDQTDDGGSTLEQTGGDRKSGRD